MKRLKNTFLFTVKTDPVFKIMVAISVIWGLIVSYPDFNPLYMLKHSLCFILGSLLTSIILNYKTVK